MHRAKKTHKHNDIIVFAIWFLAIFLVSFITFYFLGLLPEEITGKQSVVNEVIKERVFESFTPTIKEEKGEIPIKLYAPSVSLEVKIVNPPTSDTNVLNEYLKKGAVRFPGSGMLGKGNLFLFGHSADPKLYQGYYTLFNGISKLKVGDTIFVESEGFVYEYKVRSSELQKASEVYVDFTKDENILTLSTCNAFGTREDRYIVEAKFLTKKPI